jgi:hypothetical protein
MLGEILAVYGKTLAEVVPVEGGPQVVVHGLKARYCGGHKFIVEQLADFGIWWLHATQVQFGYFIGPCSSLSRYLPFQASSVILTWG